MYIGSDDPNELVAGKGIKQLKDAGINVVTGVLKEECDALMMCFSLHNQKDTVCRNEICNDT